MNGVEPRIKVGLVQIGELTWTRRKKEHWYVKNGLPIQKPSFVQPASLVYLPYSVGLLQVYAQKYAKNPEQFEFLLPIFSPIRVTEGVQQLAEADIVGFSAYVWNIQLSLAMARALKSQKPDVVIVFGGPQVPDHAETFLRENPFIDLVCHGEGEPVFLEILENYATRNWSDIPSISYLKPDGFFETHPRVARLKEISEIPSPYLEGIFDPLIASNPQYRWLVMWETNRGCPFSCTFCDWGSAVASKVYRFDMERLTAEIEWFARNKINHLFVCDANFGILPRDVEIAQLLVDINKRYRNYLAISVQNAKNATERTYQIQKILSQIITAGVTLSMQSLDTITLENIKRDNISLSSFQELQRRYTRDGISTYTDIIIGLPGETYDSFANGVANVIKNGQHNRIAFYNCTILPNAEMGNPEYQKRFGIISLPVAIIHEYDTLERISQIENQEYIQTVVSTKSLPPQEWLKVKVFAWMTELLHLNRLLQIVFVLLNEVYSVGYRDLIEAFTTTDSDTYPVFAHLNQMFLERAKANQSGEIEYFMDEKWLKILWPMPQYAFLWLATEEKLEAFYQEAELILTALLQSRGIAFNPTLLNEAITFNRILVRQPFQFKDVEVAFSYNLWEFYQSVLLGSQQKLEQCTSYYNLDRTSLVWLDWENWAESLVLGEYRRGDYIYPVKVKTRTLPISTFSSMSVTPVSN